jgi:hypothetical protein
MNLLAKGLFAAFLLIAIGQPAAQTSARATAPVFPPGASLSVEEMVAASQSMADFASATNKHIQHLQSVARKGADIIKLSCVNDKYVELKAQSNVLDEVRQQLAGAGDTDARFQVYDAAKDAVDKVRTIREEADACIGASELGAVSDATFTAPLIVDDPTAMLPFEDNSATTLEPPAYASPFN